MTYPDIDTLIKSAETIRGMEAGFISIDRDGVDWYGMAEYLGLPTDLQKVNSTKIVEHMFTYYLVEFQMKT